MTIENRSAYCFLSNEEDQGWQAFTLKSQADEKERNLAVSATKPYTLVNSSGWNLSYPILSETSSAACIGYYNNFFMNKDHPNIIAFSGRYSDTRQLTSVESNRPNIRMNREKQFKNMVNRIIKISKLSNNWDSYGSNSIDMK